MTTETLVHQPAGHGLSKVLITSREELLLLGRQVARAAIPGQIYLLEGPIGSGKTTFVKGFLSEKLGIDEELISSPTFQCVNLYGESPLLCHFDLYSLKSLQEFNQMGFGEFFHPGSIVLVEWPEVLSKWTEKREAIALSFIPITASRRQVIFPASLKM